MTPAQRKQIIEEHEKIRDHHNDQYWKAINRLQHHHRMLGRERKEHIT